MNTPIVLPDLGVGSEPIRVSSWFVTEGEHVEAGDRIVELLISGVTFDVPSPVSGVLARIDMAMNAVVFAGDVVGTITADDSETTAPPEPQDAPGDQDGWTGEAL